MLSHMQAFTTDPAGLFQREAPVVQLVGPSEQHRREDGRVLVKTRNLKAFSTIAEKGAFPLLYPYGEEHEPFDLATYLESKRLGTGTGPSFSSDPPVDVNKCKGASLTWADHAKRGLYTHNLLFNSGNLLQMWLLRTATNIEDMRLKLLESEQTSRIVSERELRTAADNSDEPYQPGRLYLPDNYVNSLAYWKSKLLDTKALVYRRTLPSLLVTLTMNPWREEMERLGLDIGNRSTFTPRGSRPRLFDRPDLTARVYNQFSNNLMREMDSNSEEFFGPKCVGMASKLECHERNTLHYHIMVILEGGRLEDLN